MDLALQDEIKELMGKRSDCCVSLYLPTHKTGRERLQDPIRLDNLLREAEKELVAAGTRPPEARDLLQPAQELLQDALFTHSMDEGLSIFISRDFFKYFKLPFHFQERLHCGRQFYLKPFVPLVNCCSRFYILALSRKALRLIESTEFGANEINLGGVPRSMQEALGYDQEATPLFRSNPGPVSMVHGHGGAVELDKTRLLRWFQILKECLHPIFGQEKIPLVFAGVEHLFPVFRQVEVYKNTVSEFIEGNPDEIDSLDLQKKGLRLVYPYFKKEKDLAVRRWADQSGGPLASADIVDIVPGAVNGRIETLLIDSTAQQWGTYDPASGAVEVHREHRSGDEELLDLAFSHAFLNGAKVYELDSPEMAGKSAAALFRY